MKTLQLAIIGTAIILTSCSSSKQTASSEYDDIYYNPEKVAQEAEATPQYQSVPQTVIVAEPMVQEQIYASSQTNQDEYLSDYELYKMQ